jgi:hypothetical protein
MMTGFWDRFATFVDKWEKDNPALAAASHAAGFAVTHTGGGCVALEAVDQSGGVWVLLTDGDADLPTDLDQQCCAGGTDNDSGCSICGIDSVTPREFFSVHKTFANLCALLLAREGNEMPDYATAAHMLNEATERGCVHPLEAATACLIISLEREQRK